MSLHLHRARRADRLVGALAEVLADPLPDPFATEIVVVPTHGIERWLAQSLSRRLGRTEPETAEPTRADGVCAGVEFLSPQRLAAEATAAVTGVERQDDPWSPQRTVWPLAQIITDAADEPWAATLWRHLRAGRPEPGPVAEGAEQRASGGRRYAVARHLAQLVHRYATSRPGLLEQWQDGRDLDPGGQPLPAEFAWQAEAYRRLRARIGAAGPVERLTAVCARLVAEPGLVRWPDRLSFFGVTRLSGDQLSLIEALAVQREIHLWLPHPSPSLWSAVAGVLADLPPRPDGSGPDIGHRSRVDDPTAAVPHHRLLAYLGRDLRELQVELSGLVVSADVDHDRLDPTGVDTIGPDPTEPDLLHRLQRDIADDRALLELPTARISAGDRSVSVHASHGPDRQVEVLRELLLNRLQDDPGLEPRDIIVMCPDIETFAPLISAAFGVDAEELSDPHPGHRLRVRLADRSLRRVNPLLAVLGQLFELADSRTEASRLLDLCSSAPVAAKFGLSPDGLARLRQQVERSGVRWGRDTDDRRRFGMGDFAQNTWSAGLDRLLLGVAMDEGGARFLGTTLPFDDVDSGDVETLGQFSELIARVGAVIEQMSERRPLAAWVALCRDALDALTDVPAAESWQQTQAYGELARIGSAAPDGAESGLLLSRSEVETLLAEAFEGRPTRANFRTGTLTMCTMLPMRSVPHRIVCLLGLDDGVFPRAGRPDGDDVLAVDPWIGDRDPRSEDRQLMLDAITAATDELIVIYAGADPRSNAIRPPSVPVGELLDVLDLTARGADGGPVRDQILHRHPLQPFDPRNFLPVGDGPWSAPFSFDRAGLAGARALVQPDRPAAAHATPAHATRADLGSTGPDPGPKWIADLPTPPEPDTVELTELIRFLSHPVRAFLRSRVGLSGWEDDPPPPDEIPISLDQLEAWNIGDRLLKHHLSGVDLGRLTDAEWRRGTLPPRLLGNRTLAPVADNVRQLAEDSRAFRAGERRQIDVRLQLGSIGFSGTLTSIWGERLVGVNYSRLGPKHRLQAWVELLALTASEPSTSWTAVTVGRGGRSLIGPVPPRFAKLLLADLVDLYLAGLRSPLPLPIKTAAEFAAIRYRDRPAKLPLLERIWKDERDAAFSRFWGEEATVADLEREPSIPAEERGDTAERSRFGTLARRVWQPLLGSEVVT